MKKDLDLFDILAFFVEKMLRLHWKNANRLPSDSIIWKRFTNKFDSLTICFQEKIAYDKLNQLEYLDLCIHETLRLYPSVTRYEYSEQHVQDNNLYKMGYYTFCYHSRFDRYVTEDVTIKGIHIHKGTLIVMCPFMMHRLPEYFPEPEKFKPER